ncbi:PilN domain-containing protein [Cupriavidus gilardii]|uniref:PilN domain-containing protein n=1 Tax=Cupriavidus gilardii TaxID=82541 RepID=UPI0021B4A216|nr:PilN domain-containing protein [Cupriavidus gilardii]UXC36287.1 PilN domain-containing protein [Cupriavidus gilardii]
MLDRRTAVEAPVRAAVAPPSSTPRPERRFDGGTGIVRRQGIWRWGWHRAAGVARRLTRRLARHLARRAGSLRPGWRAAAGFAGAAVLVGGYGVDRRIAAVERENRTLAEQARQWEAPAREAARLRQEITVASRRGSALDALLSDRLRPARLLDALARHVPPGIQLRNIGQQGDTVTIEGVARRHERVAALLRGFEPLPWLARAELIESRAESFEAGTAGTADQAAGFAFSVRLVYRPFDTTGTDSTVGASTPTPAQPHRGADGPA